MALTQATDGRVTVVRGAVLDITFDVAMLPTIDDALLITPDKGASIIVEVQSHLDETTVRAIALLSTAGCVVASPHTPAVAPNERAAGGALARAAGRADHNGVFP